MVFLHGVRVILVANRLILLREKGGGTAERRQQPAPATSYSLRLSGCAFGEAAEFVQPCLSLATKNVEREGHRASLSGSKLRISDCAGSFGPTGGSLWGSGWPRDGVSWLAKHGMVFGEQW